MKGKNTKIELKPGYEISASSLDNFLNCPRCFWLEYNKRIKRPKTPASTLTNGMDLTIKNYFDNYRKEGLPTELRGILPGRLLSNIETIKKLRGKNKVQVSDDIFLTGKLDDAMELDDGTVVPFDYKTRGFPLKEIHSSYINQLSCYTYILRENGYKTKNLGYLIFWYLDHKNMDFANPLKFNIQVEEIRTEPDRIKQEVLRAIDCLKGEIPEPGVKLGEKGEMVICEFCEYQRKLTEIFL